jgi:hypothetical protein
MVSITASDIRAFVAKRMADTWLARPARRVKRRNGTWQELPEVRRPVSVAEINRELTVLKRMFSLAVEAGKLHRKPHIAMLREDNVGFFEREQYEAVLAHLPEAMRPVVTLRTSLGGASTARSRRSSGDRSIFAWARSGSIQAPRRTVKDGSST